MYGRFYFSVCHVILLSGDGANSKSWLVVNKNKENTTPKALPKGNITVRHYTDDYALVRFDRSDTSVVPQRRLKFNNGLTSDGDLLEHIKTYQWDL